ncbi:proteasome complex subunit Rpn13 ubiquitin receptor-domain-containing protein [Halteromyces radiatus]|uniref:proteasome complex subunit Rpn13 ubiquitin receptor-domain-containing protein n=1 Tax=Halteromyces radiatus TaxID=101107 RepID=UPI00221F718C|nr:proteasome complex subunit Rpn13 ubiquitin receptor-domain-containing protein [Halteromyces radiatus]KAI8083032.1 proteasome complex subunit Rpn13 ubiquitin receptor-domain-containing protein [Halteromyces radiatus]
MSFFPTAQRPSHLVEFNAGKCIRENNTLKPDLRKGVIYMDQSDDQLMHFYWKERKASEPEEDLIIFPDEAEMVRVQECTTGRVYLLKFKSSNQKLFFWMQSKNDEKDEEMVNKVNRLINDPQSVIEEGRSSGRMDFSNDSQDLMQILGDSGQDIGMSQENLMQFLQAAGGFGGTVPTTTRLGGDGPIDSSMEVDEGHEQREDACLSSTQVESIKNILADITVEDTSDISPIDLAEDVVSVNALTPLLQDDALRQALFPDVPSTTTTNPSQSELTELVQSTNFQSSLQKLNKALQTNALDSILTFLGLDSLSNVNTFLKSMEEQAEIRHRQRQAERHDPMEH